MHILAEAVETFVSYLFRTKDNPEQPREQSIEKTTSGLNTPSSESSNPDALQYEIEPDLLETANSYGIVSTTSTLIQILSSSRPSGLTNQLPYLYYRLEEIRNLRESQSQEQEPVYIYTDSESNSPQQID